MLCHTLCVLRALRRACWTWSSKMTARKTIPQTGKYLATVRNNFRRVHHIVCNAFHIVYGVLTICGDRLYSHDHSISVRSCKVNCFASQVGGWWETQFYFAKSVIVPSMSYTELLQFHQTRRIHHKQSGKVVKFVAQITFSSTSPELSPLFGNKVCY